MSETDAEMRGADSRGADHRDGGAGGIGATLVSAKGIVLGWARIRAVQVGGGALLLVLLAILAWRGTRPDEDLSIVGGEMTHTVKRGDLRISFTEKGEIKSSKSQEIFCEVEGRSTIVSVVPEGTSVEAGDLLVELDSSELTQMENQQKISVEQATAAYQSAEAQLEIQKSLNESSIQQAELSLLLAEIDLEKYTGERGALGESWDPLILLEGDEALLADVTGRARAEIEEVLRRAIRQKAAAGAGASAGAGPSWGEAGGEARPAGGDPYPSSGGNGDPSDPVPAVAGGGSAGEVAEVQDYSRAGRRIKSGDFLLAYQKALADVKIASAEVARARNQKEWTETLAQKGYVTGTEVVADRLSLQKAELNEQQTKGTLQLFLTYTWRQSFEKYKSAVEQAQAALERARKKAEAELRQAETDLAGKIATLDLSKKRLTKIEDQITKTTIRAPQAGMVVYHREGRFGRETMLEAGAQISENQLLMRLPTVGAMAVEVQVHESWIDQVREGLLAYVSIDALPNLNIRGRVTKVGILPDQVNRWLNPDLKVYKTEVTLDDGPDVRLLRPGMSAKVEMVVTLLRDVISVPVQSVTTIDKQQVCYVVRGRDFVPQPVVAGSYNESYIDIVSGLKEGDVIRLNAPPPQGSSNGTAPEDDEMLRQDLAELPPGFLLDEGPDPGGRQGAAGREGVTGRGGTPGREGMAPGMAPGRGALTPGRERGQGGPGGGSRGPGGRGGLDRGPRAEGGGPPRERPTDAAPVPAASTEGGTPVRAAEIPAPRAAAVDPAGPTPGPGGTGTAAGTGARP